MWKYCGFVVLLHFEWLKSYCDNNVKHCYSARIMTKLVTTLSHCQNVAKLHYISTIQILIVTRSHTTLSWCHYKIKLLIGIVLSNKQFKRTDYWAFHIRSTRSSYEDRTLWPPVPGIRIVHHNHRYRAWALHLTITNLKHEDCNTVTTQPRH